MASLLGWLKKGGLSKVYDQINPFDAGLTYKQRTPVVPQQSVLQQAQKMTAPVGRFALPAVRGARDFGTSIYDIGMTVPNEARTILALATGNKPAAESAFRQATEGINTIKDFARFIPRSAVQIGQSVNPLGSPTKREVVPTNAFTKFVLGEQPVPSIQKIYQDTKVQSGSSAEAAGTAAFTTIMDLLALKGGVEAGVKGTKAAGPHVKEMHVSQRGGPEVTQPKVISVPKAKEISRLAPEEFANAVQAGKIQVAQPKPTAGLIVKPTLPSTQTKAPTPTVPRVVEGLAPMSPYTKAPKSPNAFERSWQTVNGVISQHGTGGKEIARRMGEYRNKSEIGQQAFLDKIPTVTKLKKNEFTTFVQTLERLSKGEKVNAAPNIQRAIAEWNQAIPEIRNRAVSAGLEVGDLGPNYFPRQYKDLFTSDRVMGKMAEQMVRDGKAKDLGDAMGKLQFMKNEYQRPFGNLERTREFDLPGYEMTPEALANYVSRSFDRITKAEQLGPKNEILHQLQARMQQEGYSATPGSVVDKSIRTALGDVDKGTTGHKVSGGIRQFNALRSLSTAGISNATQLPVNTGTIAGMGRTVKGAFKLAVSPKVRAEARQTGVALDHAIANLSQQALGVSGITRNIASPFFKQVEKFNRLATAVVGKDYGNHLAKKVASGNKKAEIVLREKFGITGEIGKKLTREQEIQMSRKLVELAQFKVDPMDLPGWVDSPMGKLVAQFRTFGYKQSDFMWNQVLREAVVKHNFLPLARFVAVGIPAGAASLALKGKIKGVDYISDEDSNLTKATKSLAAVGGFGLPGSEGQNLYKSNQYGNTIGGIAGTFGGPTASLIAETAVNLDKARQGNTTPLKKQGVRNIPAIGPSIANRMFPSKTSQVAAAKKSPSEVTELKSGKFYAKSLDKEYDTEQDANKAVAKDKFDKSGKSHVIVGETVFRRSADGKITDMPKIKYENSINTATLTQQKRSGDVEGWINTANKQLDNITRQLQDPAIDPLDAIALQNQAQTLLDNMAKYQGYGGFTKGRSGGRGGRGGVAALTGSFKTASGVKAPSIPNISFRKPTPPARRQTTKRISVNKIPTNYLNRKLA